MEERELVNTVVLVKGEYASGVRLAGQTINIFNLQDGEPPVREQIQGIQTFPFYSLVQAPAVLERLGVAKGGRVEAYLIRYRSWQRQDIDKVLSVVPQQVRVRS